MEKTDIGIYSLGVRSSNLALNLEQNGLTVSLSNRAVPGEEEDVVDSFLESKGTNKNFVGSHSIEKFIVSLKKPHLFRQISLVYGWNINLAEIARIWQNRCSIRSKLLKTVQEAFFEDSEIEHLLSALSFAKLLKINQQAFRETISLCIRQGTPCPAMCNALAYYDSIRSGWLPANIIQVQRDYFGAQGYERTDRDRGDFYHSDWNLKT